MIGTLDTERLFKTIDAKDADGFADFLTEDVSFSFGSAAPVLGREAARDAVVGFYGSVKALHHDVMQTWEEEDAIIAEGRATYTRHDGTTVTLPFVNVMRLDGELVNDYRIYVDIAPLYAP